MTVAEIRTPRVLLRAFQASDAVDRARWGDDPGILRNFGASVADNHDPGVTLEEATNWLAPILEEEDPLHWAVEHDGQFIGTARLHSLVDADRRARYAVGILDPARLGIGLGTEITSGVLDYAFDALDLHRVDLRVLAFNERAIRCYLRCGFIVEGQERESAHIAGRWHDDIIMSMLVSEWRARTR